MWGECSLDPYTYKLQILSYIKKWLFTQINFVNLITSNTCLCIMGITLKIMLYFYRTLIVNPKRSNFKKLNIKINIYKFNNTLLNLKLSGKLI